jgi:hypothetical protein
MAEKTASIAFLSVLFPIYQMKRTKLALLAIVFGIAIWNFWPHQATEIKTVKAVTPVVTPVTKVLSRHTVAKKQVINNETETALNSVGLTLTNSVGVAVASSKK